MHVLSSLLKKNILLKRLSKSRGFYRFRQHFPQEIPDFDTDPALLEWKDAQTVIMDWPHDIKKPMVGLVRDIDPYPRWTKYVLFLQKNIIPFEFYDLHRSDWLEQAKKFDAIIGLYSNSPSYLDEARRKIYFLEKNLGKACYPSAFHLQLYEDKRFEAYFCKIFNFPFAEAFITYDKREALEYVKTVKLPVVSKLDPSSGSVAVELIKDRQGCRRIIRQAFSSQGRRTHLLYYRQKDYVYFQEFIPNDGFDIRVLVTKKYATGYRRQAPQGDFRGSGMDLIHYGSLPAEAVIIARKLFNCIKSPMLAVDFVHGNDGKFHIIEYSPLCQVRKPSGELVLGERGLYVFDTDETYHYEKRMTWIHDLILEEFFTQAFLARSL